MSNRLNISRSLIAVAGLARVQAGPGLPRSLATPATNHARVGVDAAFTERKPLGRHRKAFSLLEMILALAILGTSLGILAQVAQTGRDAALEAHYLSQARLIAQSKLAEILVTGTSPAAIPLTPVESMSSDSANVFEYQVDVAPAPFDGMLAIRVSVFALDEDGGPNIASYSLTRWWIDPLLDLPGLAAEEKALREEASAE